MQKKDYGIQKAMQRCTQTCQVSREAALKYSYSVQKLFNSDTQLYAAGSQESLRLCS